MKLFASKLLIWLNWNYATALVDKVWEASELSSLYTIVKYWQAVSQNTSLLTEADLFCFLALCVRRKERTENWSTTGSEEAGIDGLKFKQFFYACAGQTTS